MKAKYNQLASGSKVPASLTAMETQIKKIDKEITNLNNQKIDLNSQINNNQVKYHQAKKVGNDEKANILATSINQNDAEVTMLDQKMNDLTLKSEKLSQKLQELKLNPQSSQEALNLKSKIDLAEESLKNSKKEANELVNNIKKSQQIHFKGLGINLKDINPINDGFKKLGDKVDRFKKKMTRLISTAMIFSLIRKGLTSLSNGFVSLLKSNDTFSNSLNRIKANLMTAIAPIYNYVLPAINSLMNVLSKVTGTIATFISSLFGKTADQAKNNAKQLYNQAKATEAVGEAQEQLGSFDKLEVNGDDSSSSGGRNSNNNINFNTPIEVDSKLLDFFNELKRLIGDGKWFDVGSKIAQSLNNLLQRIDVKGFMKKGTELAVNLIRGFNGFIKTFDFKLLAQKISDFLLGLGTLIISSLVMIDWIGIGQTIGDLILGIDWWGILVDILSITSALLDACFGLVAGLLKSIGEHLIEWIPNLWEIIKSIPGWINENIILPIATLLIELLSSIINAVGLLVENIIDGAKKVLEAIIEIGLTLIQWINNTLIQPTISTVRNMWNILIGGAQAAWEGIKQVFGSVASFFGTVFGTAWKVVKGVFSTGGKVFDGIKEGIINAFKAVVNALIKGINTIVGMPFRGLNNILDRIHDISFLGISPFSWLSWRAPVPQIPYLATGAVIPPNAKFAAVLGDQTHGKNLEAPESLIRKIVREESGEKEVILNATFIMQCETEEIGRAAFKGLKLLENIDGQTYLVN